MTWQTRSTFDPESVVRKSVTAALTLCGEAVLRYTATEKKKQKRKKNAIYI